MSRRVKNVLKRLIIRQSAARPFLNDRYTARHRVVDHTAVTSLEQSIQTNYHFGWRTRSNYSDEASEKDLQDHLFRRRDLNRSELVPWLDSLRHLDNSKILEIGCGTGSSTVALAEQGATVTAIDIDEGALQVAIDRCKTYGIDAEFRNNSFDFIIFFACLEHMTVTERPVQELTIASLSEFNAHRKFILHTPAEEEYKNILHQQCPVVPKAFLEKQLDIAVRKN